MLDWIFILLIMLAILFMILSIEFYGQDNYWNIILIPLTISLWFIIAILTTGGIQTPYSVYNSTTGNTTLWYDTYAPAEFIYLSYVFGLLGVLNIIYLIVTIFGYYYERIDRQNRRKDEESME
jgi:hypothetical protein